MPRGYDPYNDPYSDRIGELIRARGDIAARQSLESGDIWGRGIQNIAGQLGAGVQQYAQQREQQKQAEELSKRDAVWTSYIESGEWQKDPNKALGISKRIWGPDYKEHFGALKAADELIQSQGGKKDPERTIKNLGAMAASYSGLGEGGKDKIYPAIRALAMQNMPELQMPEARDPAYDEVIGQFAAQFGPAKKTAVVGKALVEEATGKEIYKAPEEVKKHLVTVPGPGGQPVQRLASEEELATGVTQYQKPEAAAAPTLQQVTVTGPDGQPMLAVFNPKTGKYTDASGSPITAPKPSAAAARPPTEGETKAAGFYDRALKAEQVVKVLEAAGKGKPGFWESWTPDKMLPEDRRLYLQAQRDFTISHLRPESGAAISKEEYAEDAKTYFPQHGDSQAVINQKAAARKAILDSLEAQGGKAVKTTPVGAPPPPTASPKVGAVEEGYRYKGGDPADPSSWEKV